MKFNQSEEWLRTMADKEDNADVSVGRLSQLGSKTPLPLSPDEAIIETFDNQNQELLFNVRFNCPEFSSNCPITGAPDFAKIIIDYIPKVKMIESKSLKLFLGSFRYIGSFHENCTMKIANRLCKELDPRWFRIGAFWYARGGIALDVFWQSDVPPIGVYIPKFDIKSYGGR
jgi:7-cyano-7-deazaguanine reductase